MIDDDTTPRQVSEFERATLQLALVQHRRDVAEHGTADWETLVEYGHHESYLKDAEIQVGALALLGWAPLHPYGALYLTDPRDTLKMLRETLAVAQSAIGIYWRHETERHVDRLGRLIAEIDRQRPLGPVGAGWSSGSCAPPSAITTSTGFTTPGETTTPTPGPRAGTAERR